MATYATYLERSGEYGIVEEIKHPIVTISGLPHVRPNELVICETGELGQVFTIDRESVKILLFSKTPVRVGTKVTRTEQTVAVPAGAELIGQVINPLGQPLSAEHKYTKPKQVRELDQDVKKIHERARITLPLMTGTSVVDLMVPLGKGQRELVIGDRKTGKTAFLNTLIRQQIKEGSIVIYAAIGKKKGEIKKMVEYFQKNKFIERLIFIGTDSQDPASLIFLTPLTAMTIAEHLRDEGMNVVVLFDDLTTHAKFYREVSLLAERFPGRDSYPGDIFYTHAKLLERAGNFQHEKGPVSITCIPLVETIEGDLTGYIQTNLMGITDGHIFFDSNAYYNGRRPAINISLSVTRVGKQTQTALKKEINRELSAFLATYEKMQNFSHFGAELSPQVVSTLKRGEKLYEFFDQHFDLAIPVDVQIVLLGLVWTGFFDDSDRSVMDSFKHKLSEQYEKQTVQKFISELASAESFQRLVEAVTSKKDDIVKLCKTDKS